MESALAVAAGGPPFDYDALPRALAKEAEQELSAKAAQEAVALVRQRLGQDFARFIRLLQIASPGYFMRAN